MTRKNLCEAGCGRQRMANGSQIAWAATGQRDAPQGPLKIRHRAKRPAHILAQPAIVSEQVDLIEPCHNRLVVEQGIRQSGR